MSSPTPSPEHPSTAELRKYVEGLKHNDDLDLLCHMSGWKEGFPHHRALKIELERRAKKRERFVSWIALAVGIASIVVSVWSAWLGHSDRQAQATAQHR